MPLISVNKTIIFTLNNSTASATAVINIPFLVSRIVIKSICIDKTGIAYTGLDQNALLQSDLVQNNILGSINMSATTYQPIPNITYEYENPVAIQGTYKFTLLGNTLLPFSLQAGIHSIGLQIEFIK